MYKYEDYERKNSNKKAEFVIIALFLPYFLCVFLLYVQEVLSYFHSILTILRWARLLGHAIYKVIL